jgi:hypothetical protein
MTMATVVLTVIFAGLSAGALVLAWIAAASGAFRPRALLLSAAVCAGLAAWGIADLVG